MQHYLPKWLYIVGVNEKGLKDLDAYCYHLIIKAKHIVGSKNYIEMVQSLTSAQCHQWQKPFDKNFDILKKIRGQQTVILATGDPMNFGVGTSLLAHFDLAEISILPNLSAFSLVSAQMGWPIEQTECISLHGRSHHKLKQFLYRRARIIALGWHEDTGSQIAKTLVETGFGHAKINAFSHLGGPKAMRVQQVAHLWHDLKLSAFTSFAIDLGDQPSDYIGAGPIVDDGLLNHDGQLTKSDLRALALAKLRPFAGSILWDMGAGSGAISIEWARAKGKAIAIEKRLDRCQLIAKNIAFWGMEDLIDVWHGNHVDFVKQKQQTLPDAIFIGGGVSGGIYVIISVCS
ncbi:MAG: precorrin-6y C5,15-methyltransferase (decarboxylating) subunit CbiE [Pseudomonadota bacterium]